MNKEKILKAGKIASQVKGFAKSVIKQGVPLLGIAEKIENKIIELGAKPAFPVNLSINDIAAHYTPSYNDEKKAQGLLKVDIGVHIDGNIADTAFTLDLENSETNKKLIKASEDALKNTLEIINSRTSLNKIGGTIQQTIEKFGFTPIINLSGHEMRNYELHAGLTIPNIDNSQTTGIGQGLFAIEPFATTGSGKVYDGKLSEIYGLINEKKPRSPIARKVLEFIQNEYKTLPFCSRWIVKKFGPTSLFALKQLEDNGNLHHFPQLVEVSHEKVSQAEDTIFIEKDEIVVTTE